MFEKLKNTNNLLAFSGGVDSTALFFILLENHIDFDIAIVNYNTRHQSLNEVMYAQKLAEQYNKKIFVKTVTEQLQSNFEMLAREIRYNFFEEIIHTHQYKVLLTAHQLNDRFEWFLMQLAKGAGISTLIGMEQCSHRNGYDIIRPLLHKTKDELLHYLHQHNITYFIDETNHNTKYKRNYFRQTYSDPFIKEFAKGIQASFTYLESDKKSLALQTKKIFEKEELTIFQTENNTSAILNCIDFQLKKKGILLSSNTKKEILKQKQITISDLFCVAIDGNLLWIAPKTDLVMDKAFKECTRIARIPQNIRPYLKQLLGECHEIQKLIASIRIGGDLSLDK